MAVSLAFVMCHLLIITPISFAENDEKLKSAFTHLMHEAILEVLVHGDHTNDYHSIDFMSPSEEARPRVKRSSSTPMNDQYVSSMQSYPANNNYLPPVPRISSWDEEFFNARDLSKTVRVMETLRSRINGQSSFLIHLFKMIKNAIHRRDSPILYSQHVYRNLVSFQKIHMRAMRGLRSIHFQGTKLTVKDLQIKISDLRKLIDTMKLLVTSIESTYTHVAFRNQHTVMSGLCKLTVVQSYVLNSTALAIGRVNDMSINTLMANTVFLDRPAHILGRKFLPSIGVFNTLSGVINGIDLSKALLSDRANLVTAPVAMNHLHVFGDLSVSFINGINIGRDTVLLQQGSYKLTTPFIFNGYSTAINTLRTSQINRHNVDYLLRDVMISDVEQIISGHIIASGSVSFRQPVGTKMFNRLDFTSLASDLVRLNQPLIHLGSKMFLRSVYVVNDLFINGTLNRLQIPRDLLLTSVPQTVIAPKRFVGHHSTYSDVIVTGRVDGLSLPHDVVTLSGSDPLPPLRFVRAIDVFSNMRSGLVDSVDLSRLNYESIKASQGVLFNPVFRGPVFVHNDLTVAGPINGHDISFLYRDIVFLYQKGVVPITGTKVFTNFAIQSLRVGRINGYPLSALVTVRRHESLPLLSLVSARFNQTHVASGTVNGINILRLYSNRISLSIPGYLPAGVNFIHELRVSQSLTVAGRVQDLIPTRDLVLKSAHQEIIAPKRFVNLRISQNLIARNGLNCRLIDGLNVTWINLMKVSLTQPQILNSRMVLSNARVDSLMTAKANSITLRDFLPNVMVKSSPQRITSPKIFYSIFALGDVVTAKGVNGVYLPQVDRHAIHLHGNTFIDEMLTFTNSLSVGKDVTVNGPINGISLPLFLSSVLMKNTRAVISGPLSLFAPLTVVGKIEPTRVNTVWLPQVILLKKYDQVIRSNVTMKRASFRKSLSLAGSLNGIDLDKFDRSIMRVDRPNVFRGDLIFKGPVNVNSHVHVRGLLSDIDIRRAALQTMYKAFDQTINGQTTLQGPIVFTGSLKIARLNNRGFQQNLDSIIRTSKPAFISHPVSFKRGQVRTLSNVISNSGSTTIAGATNNLLLAQLFDSLVYTNRPCLLNGYMKFVDDIYAQSTVDIAGTINQVNLYNDVLFRVPHPSGKVQTVSGRTRFDSLWSEGDIEVTGTVNGLHLPSLFQDSLLDYSNQKINGRKYFTGSFVIDNNSAVKNLNNITNLANELIQLNRFQYFNGRVDFVNPIRVVGDVSIGGRLSGHNFSELLRHSLYKDVPQSIPGALQFERLVFYSNVTTAGPVNKVYLRNFNNDVHRYSRSVKTAENIMSTMVNKQLQTNSLMYDSLLASPYELSHFELKQQLAGVHGNYFETQGRTMYSVSELDANGVNSTVHQVRYKRESQSFESFKVHRNVPFIKRVFFHLGGKDFSVHRASFNSESVTEIRQGSRVIATLDAYIDDFTVLATKEMAVIASLLGLKGQIKVHTLRYVDGRPQFNQLAVLKVGPSANKMILFVEKKTLFLAVARSFRGQCSVGDYGSLLFQLIGTSFKLVQRLPVNDGHHVIHYRHKGRHYLAFSDGGSHYDFQESSGVQVFYMKNGLACHLMPFAKLHFDNLRDLAVVSFGPQDRESILLAAINATTLTVWKQEGVFGFSRSWSMPVSNGQAVYPVSADNDLYLVASQGNRCTGSLVFRAVFSGASLKPLIFQRHWSSIS